MIEQKILLYIFACVPIVLLGVVCWGILFIMSVKKGREYLKCRLNVLIFCVTMLYLILFTLFAFWCTYQILEIIRMNWLIPFIVVLLSGGCVVLGYLVKRGLMPVQEKQGIIVVEECSLEGMEETNDKILTELLRLFDEEQIYREVDLRIQDVAIRIGTNRTYVSGAINKNFGVRFSGFVNGYRIREAQKLLLASASSVHDIAGIVGFKNTSTFNFQFKEICGQSPLQWKQQFSGKVK